MCKVMTGDMLSEIQRIEDSASCAVVLYVQRDSASPQERVI